MSDEYYTQTIDGLEPGMILYNITAHYWAVIVYDENKSKDLRIGVKPFIKNTGGPWWGAEDACLNKYSFKNVWKIAGDAGIPEVPKEYKYEPPNNQGRRFCFWHSKIRTTSLYVKELNITFNYCPECKR